MLWERRTCSILLFNLIVSTECLHLRGSWTTSEYFKFLDRFGFQQTDLHDKKSSRNTQGYVYGNITSREVNITSTATLVVVDSAYFLQYYGNRTLSPRGDACHAMFKNIAPVAWDPDCNPQGQEDFLRKIPCKKDRLCVDNEDITQDWIIPGFQFTFQIQDVKSPRFWYISLVSCRHNDTDSSTCTWTYDTQQDTVIDYDIWLVNGHPLVKHINPFEHQFSFEHHDIFEVYLAFFIVYSLLVPIQLYALSRQKHMLPLLLTMCMAMEYVGIIFNLIHVLKFAFDGDGVEMLKVVGNFIDGVAQCIFMLMLLLIVKGWTITRMNLSTRAKAVLFTMWGTYTAASMGLFIWNLTEVDLISDTDEWQTWPGYLILAFRIAIMLWFLLELRETFELEAGREKTRFYLHFGAGFLVWFVYLPIAAVICTHVSALWRYKTMLSVQYSADFLSYCVMVHLLWPTRSYMYFNLKVETRIPMEELEFAGQGQDESVSDEDSVELHETAALIQQDAPPVRISARSQANGPLHAVADSNQKSESQNFLTTQAVIENSSAGKAGTTFSYTSTLLDLDEQGSGSAWATTAMLEPAEASFTAGPKYENGDSGIELIAGINGEFEPK